MTSGSGPLYPENNALTGKVPEKAEGAGAGKEDWKNSQSECVLIYAPIGRDAFLAAKALHDQGILTLNCPTVDTLIAALKQEVAVLLLAMDGLNTTFLEDLALHLKTQPAWSDLPILLLASADEPAALESALNLLGNVTLLQRPLRRASLLSAVQTSLRARRRQYQVRDLLASAETARKEAERQQGHILLLNERLRRAMTETHHRVKNNLQVIAAMVDMQVMEDTSTLPMEEFRRLGSHIHMLATVHDLLTEKAKEDGQAHFVSSGLVLEKLLPLVEQLSGKQVAKATITDTQLSAKQGTSLALVLNELVSNAFKHGNGYVEVKFSAEEQEAVLEVADDGPGFPADFDPLRAAHTGLELVENLCRWDLAGGVRYTMRPQGGGCVRVTMPLTKFA